jgi:hypothetical protein
MENTDTEASIWCVNRQALSRKISEQFETDWTKDSLALNLHHVELAHEIIRGRLDATGTLWVEPNRLNERMAVQQGVFLMPCNLETTFMVNLLEAFAIESSQLESNPKDFPSLTGAFPPLANAFLVKLRLPSQMHAEAISELETMNVSATSLFGGLDGFARSLHTVFKPYEAHSQRVWEVNGEDTQAFA